ncbi:hypothetical protein CEXT_42541 [Caerostris extrusa]|uniref:Uncharacterized protein n=1 Tax=Caerostris extrusa TaxID=172846 RepID=A0AAV4NJ80_CAEEX|nr:hypothetical protein CEXT_42541 [Caerostris extrusa]
MDAYVKEDWDWNLMLEASTAKHCQWLVLGLIAQALPVATERNDSLENSLVGASTFVDDSSVWFMWTDSGIGQVASGTVDTLRRGNALLKNMFR